MKPIRQPRRSRHTRRRVPFTHPGMLLLPLLCLASPPGQAQTTSADEYEIRAAMLFNLTRYIEWPAAKLDATHPNFLVCILGQDPITRSAAHYFQNQTVAGKPVQLRYLNSLASTTDCHILYIGDSEPGNLARTLSDQARSGLLTISDQSNSTRLNQVIGLPSVDDHVHIEVNLDAAHNADLVISSRLLRLATLAH